MCSPAKFLAKRDRRGVQYDDPFPGLEHRYMWKQTTSGKLKRTHLFVAIVLIIAAKA